MNTTRILLPALMGSVALATPFMPWKVVKTKAEDGTEIEVVATKDGNPIWLDSNNAESVMAGDTVSRLNHEAMTNRKALETAQATIKLFEGLDPAKAREAIATVDKLDKKQLIDAGEVDKVTDQIKTQYAGELKTRDERIAELSGNLNKTKLENAFASSPFVKDKLAIPLDVAQTYFSRNIEYDDAGNMTFKYADGNPVMSKAKIGEKPDFNEAIELLVENNPNRDALLKGGNHQGSGNNGGGGGGKAGVKTYRRAEIDGMQPQAVTAAMAEVNAGTAQLTD